MSLWSDVKGTHRVSSLVGLRERFPTVTCEFCGAPVEAGRLESHSVARCFVLARYGLVYFIQQAGGDRAIKIGFTRQPVDRRLTQIRPSTPHRLRLLLTVAGTLKSEGQIQESWKRVGAHLRGEWFAPTPQLLDVIAKCQRDPAIAADKDKFRVAHLDRLQFWFIDISAALASPTTTPPVP